MQKVEVYTGDLRELVVEKWSMLSTDKPVYVYCPKHSDTLRQSMAVYADHAYCYTCGAYMTRAQFSALFSGDERTSAKILAPTLVRKPPAHSIVDAQAIAVAAHSLLWKMPDKLDWLFRRGITKSGVSQFVLGHYGSAYTIPVLGPDGKAVTVRFRRDDDEAPDAPKYWGLAGANNTLLYPDYPLERVAVMTEGEFDAILLGQEGFPSFSLTNGCKSGDKLSTWVHKLDEVERLVLCRDQDIPGQESTEWLCYLLNSYRPDLDLKVVSWDGHAKDVSELWTHSPAEFQRVVKLLAQLVFEGQ